MHAWKSTAVLKPGKEKTVIGRHPWIMSGAVSKIHGSFLPGDIIRVTSSEGTHLGFGHLSPASQIRIRMLTHDDIYPDDEWLYSQLKQAVGRRQIHPETSSNHASRLVFAESDFLPGLIVDRYANCLVVQINTAGMDGMKQRIAGFLEEICHPEFIYEKNDGSARKNEGLMSSDGPMSGREPPETVRIRENKYEFDVSIRKGQKTGFYLDQKRNRNMVSEYAKGCRVLDMFSYTGAFSVYALGAGALEVTRVDMSAQALDQGARNIGLNFRDVSNDRSIRENGFRFFRTIRDSNLRYSMIILDPPKLAPTHRALKNAARAYKDLNLQAIRCLEPGGFLVTFSCSGAVSPAFFREILWWASKDAGRELQIVEQLAQSNDHPERVSFPESLYLKGYICRVI